MRALALIFALFAACAAASAATQPGPAAGQSQAAKTSAQAKAKASKTPAKPASDKASAAAPSGKAKTAAAGKVPAKAVPAKAAATGKGAQKGASGAKSATNGKGAAKAVPIKAVAGKAAPKAASKTRAGGKGAKIAAGNRIKPAAAAAPTALDELTSRMGIGVGHLSVVKPSVTRAERVARAADGGPVLSSRSVLVLDQSRNQVLFERNGDTPRSIASITKLMTAMVVLDADLPPGEILRITDEDMDRLKGSSSRLRVGTALPRDTMLHLALVASDNRAASALSRHYPGGKAAFVEAMNRKAEALGMTATHFDDPTGLTPTNTSTARDLQRMAQAAYAYPAIRAITSSPNYMLVRENRPKGVEFRNTNRLLRDDHWTIGLSKTGYIQEAGRCLVMQAAIADRPMLIVLLQGQGRGSHFADAVRLRKWLESETVAGAPQYTHRGL